MMTKKIRDYYIDRQYQKDKANKVIGHLEDHLNWKDTKLAETFNYLLEHEHNCAMSVVRYAYINKKLINHKIVKIDEYNLDPDMIFLEIANNENIG